MRQLSYSRTFIIHLFGMTIFLITVLSLRPVMVDASDLNLSSPLLVDTRDTLQLCVQVSPSLELRKSTIIRSVQNQTAILQQKHPDWNRVYGQSVNVRSDLSALISSDEGRITNNQHTTTLFKSDCRLNIPTKRLDSSDMTAFGGGLVDNPSYFRSVIFVLDDVTANIVLGELDISHGVYEVMKVSDHEYVEVTNVVVVREGAISSSTFTDQYLPVSITLPPLRPFMVPESK